MFLLQLVVDVAVAVVVAVAAAVAITVVVLLLWVLWFINISICCSPWFVGVVCGCSWLLLLWCAFVCGHVAVCVGVQQCGCLIVGLLLQPASGVAAQVETTGLVIDEDGQRKWNSREPPDESIVFVRKVIYKVN